VVLLPIVLGMGLNAKFPKAVKKVEPFSPIVGVLSTILLVGSAVAQCSAPILAAGIKLQLTAFFLHVIGGVACYFGLQKVKDTDIEIETYLHAFRIYTYINIYIYIYIIYIYIYIYIYISSSTSSAVPRATSACRR